jgi:hypothetical protein
MNFQHIEDKFSKLYTSIFIHDHLFKKFNSICIEIPYPLHEDILNVMLHHNWAKTW